MLFTVAECHRNAVWTQLRRGCGSFCSAVVWLSVFDFIGGLLFLLAATTGAVQAATGGSHAIAHWLVDFPYMVGSFLYVVSSTCSLWMWKSDQFGLGRLPDAHSAVDGSLEASQQCTTGALVEQSPWGSPATRTRARARSSRDPRVSHGPLGFPTHESTARAFQTKCC